MSSIVINNNIYASQIYFIVLNTDMVALSIHAVKSSTIYDVYASFLLRNRYSSSCFLMSSGISLATGQTAAFVPTDTLLIVFLKYSQELRGFCGFDVVPDASKFTRFKQDFLMD